MLRGRDALVMLGRFFYGKMLRRHRRLSEKRPHADRRRSHSAEEYLSDELKMKKNGHKIKIAYALTDN